MAAKHCDVSSKLSLLTRTVTPVLMWRVSRWPWQQTTAIALDRIQNKMISIVLRVPRMPHESGEVYVRRSRRIVADHVFTVGKWSLMWAERVISWHEHVMRHNSFAQVILSTMAESWLQSRRALYLSQTCTLDAGRTGTRENQGRPQVRWLAGISLASSVANEPTTQINSISSTRMLSIATIIHNARNFLHLVTLEGARAPSGASRRHIGLGVK